MVKFIATSEESRKLDYVAIKEFGLPGIVLMENAGRSILKEALEFWPWLSNAGRRVTILSGPGQNGGDGFVLARLFSALGLSVKSYLITKPGRVPTGDAAINYSMFIVH
jgi:NAD(P)H-hydrate epimerase